MYFEILKCRTSLYSKPRKIFNALALLKRDRPGDSETAKQLLVQVVKNDLEGKEDAEEWLKKWQSILSPLNTFFMALKIRLKPRGVVSIYPVTYDVDFTSTPGAGEIEQKRKKVQDFLKAHKIAQEKKLLATPVFNLRFNWTRKKGKAIQYKLIVSAVRDKRFKKPPKHGSETPPKPKQPTIPPM